ncbi:MAG: UvrD-helicase domain-containing protein, partial [Alphaproteobacteria bacterium]|nr:UvrD-helicase domain-containing protein [Alphaproteobacteria bacterium]
AATGGEMTGSTIHGCCKRLISPYPVEADIGPGASVLDRDQAERAFAEIVDAWLREALSTETGGLLAELVLHNPDATVELVRTVLDHLRRHRALAPYALEDLERLVAAFREAADGFAAFLDEAEAEEPETAALAGHFQVLAGQVGGALPADTPAALVKLLGMTPHGDLLNSSGGFRVYRKKGKWQAALREVGLAQAHADRLNHAAGARYALCCTAWTAFHQAVATQVLAGLVPVVEPVMDRFRAHKRAAAQLDFDDLIVSARDLLRDHDEVRRALAARFRHVLVDEFQDTDPLQTEIFWRLCGEPPAGSDTGHWTTFSLRPGALFLVGDPKQAIYRFRGADIAAYVRAREVFRTQAAAAVLSIATNFRSCAPIMDYVNARFETALSEENGQPGFQSLEPSRPPRDEGLSVVALDIAVADEEGKAKVERQRDGEAEAVAELCARLIGSEPIHDRESSDRRLCRAGDIALLAPTGSDLWRYEEVLEARGIPVATQAGKRLYRRQEIQDLIAITRVLADRRDTLALGALLRGPLVGLTEEALLDIVWALPRADDTPDELPRLDLGVAPNAIEHPLARDIMEKLQALQRKANATTPHALLSQAIDVLRVRPILLLRRHRGQAERALANVDLYLSFSRAYAVRGLRAFAEAMTAAWSDEARAVEGRLDAQEDSVALYTMHAAKGLEWPIVVPINTMTRVVAPEGAVTNRASGRFYGRVFGVEPTGYDKARNEEKAELDRERVRLWYVAATRARELLVLPRLDVDTATSAWRFVIDLALPDLPALDMDHHPPNIGAGERDAENEQTRGDFAAEAAAIAKRTRTIVWRAPSRDESIARPAPAEEAPAILATNGDGAPADRPAAAAVQGGRERGRILHKLIEEVLTGETGETLQGLRARAEVLISALGQRVVVDPAQGLAPTELAECVVRALNLPEIAAIRPRLVPEFTVYTATTTASREEAAAGIVDAIAFAADGAPEVVIDWKSDVNPSPETLEHYRGQISAYLDMSGAERGLIVAVTSGAIVHVERAS